jgi:hypothetical protein
MRKHAAKLSRLRRAASPGDHLVGTYQDEIRRVEIAQVLGQGDELQLNARRGVP